MAPFSGLEKRGLDASMNHKRAVEKLILYPFLFFWIEMNI
ncbi:hypothetical protein LEP1GSC016_2973 [Leptospira borgpetersenii serovar Hardjo-bovis str. Sponselee]|uniref:Uncharacterized protein n=1 Tax=Leptospira borgpetersenii serovar Hardjo-bovis str. Sponselee TaxID=1303729 RepID=M6BKT8_LEPBO|nr:hypothetical protein LEP1GSC016_2973 [Leptospira borgpetersenii serovar Hardjo-bovis str. Sponselee]